MRPGDARFLNQYTQVGSLLYARNASWSDNCAVVGINSGQRVSGFGEAVEIPSCLLVGRERPDKTRLKVRAAAFPGRDPSLSHTAQREPVEITRHGRRKLVLMSADHHDWLVAAAKRTHRAAETPDDVLSAIERTEMDPKHATLDELLK
jgi:hypothetical protein